MSERKLELHKETLRDLPPGEDRTEGVRGGISFNVGVNICIPGVPNLAGKYTGGVSIAGCDRQRAIATPVIRTANQAFEQGNGQNGGPDQYSLIVLHKFKLFGTEYATDGTLDGTSAYPPPTP